MGSIERSVRRHFEQEIRRIRAPAPPPRETATGERRIHPFFLDALAHAAIALFIAGSLFLYVREFPRPTTLREAVASIARERTYEQYLPSEESLRNLVKNFLDRRVP